MTQEEKDNILGNVNNIPAKNLAKHIIDDNLTLEEIMDTGDLKAPERLEVISIVKSEKEKIKAQLEAEEKEKKGKEKKDWEEISDSKNLSDIEKYIENHLNGTYFKEACDLLIQIKNSYKEKDDLLKEIKNNSSTYTPDVIVQFIKSGKITKEDLINIGIPEVIIENLSKENEKIELGNIPETIEDGYTEVYFWGLPGSGKTCALSAILRTGVEDGDIDTRNGLGFHYMNQLSNIFLTKCGVLPGSTDSEKTQYLPFDLTDKRGVKHPIALIELSGEIFEANYSINNNLTVDSSIVKTYEIVKSYLNGPNKKIHFFITDVTKDPTKTDNKGITQQQHLKMMMDFLDEQKVIKNTTDGVYIIATKSDHLSDDKSQRKDLAIDHLSKNYSAFIKSMKKTLKENKIPDEIYVIPFSLGDIYFNNLCLYDDSSSLEIIEILKNKTNKKNNGGWLNWIKNLFNI